MNRKDLEKLGLTAENLAKIELDPKVLDEIIVLHGRDIEGHKTKLTESEATIGSLTSQLSEASKAIEGFKALKPEELQKAVGDWQAKATEYEAQATKAREDAAKQLAAMRFDHTLEGELTKAGVRSVKAAKALLNVEALKLDEAGAIVGSDENTALTKQLEKLREENDFLFEDAEETPTVVTGGHSRSVVGDELVEAARKGAGLPIRS